LSSTTHETKKAAPKMQELYLRQIMDGDATVGLKKGLIDLMKEYMAQKNWSEDQM
jgi:hypothetical protein